MAEESRSTGAVAAARATGEGRVLPREAAAENAVANALDKPGPVFNTHSQGLAGLLAAQARNTHEKMADVRAKIAELEAELTDLMRTESAIAKASAALVIDQPES